MSIGMASLGPIGKNALLSETRGMNLACSYGPFGPQPRRCDAGSSFKATPLPLALSVWVTPGRCLSRAYGDALEEPNPERRWPSVYGQARLAPPSRDGGPMGGAARVAPPMPIPVTPVAERSRARSAAKRSDESRRSEAQVIPSYPKRKWSNGGSNTKPRPLQ